MTPVRITYTLTAKDFVDVHRARRSAEPAQKWSLRMLYALVGLLVIAAIAMYVAEPTRATLIRVVPLFIFVVLWLMLVRLVPARLARRQFLRQPAAQSEQVTEFTEQGIRTRGADGTESSVGWNSVLRYAETESIFLVYLSPSLFVVYPKRAFDGEQLSTVRELFQRRVSRQ